MSRTRDTIEFLRHENKELKEELNELKKQVEANSFILKHGEDGVHINTVRKEIQTPTLSIIVGNLLVVQYIENDRVITVEGAIKDYLFNRLREITYKVEILNNGVKYLIFNLKFNDKGAIHNYPFMVNKETKVLSEYPLVDLNGDQKDE